MLMLDDDSDRVQIKLKLSVNKQQIMKTQCMIFVLLRFACGPEEENIRDRIEWARM